jgi:hypothetical protein
LPDTSTGWIGAEQMTSSTVGPPPVDGQGHQLLFVGGLHRSGTTVLADLIARHPEASGLQDTGVPEDEGQHLQDVYPASQLLGGPGRFARDPFAHLTESSPLATAANGRRILDAWAPYWDLSRRLLVEKTPANLIMGRFLQQLYPDACFLFIVRHPVVVSLATRKWRPRTTFDRLLEHWFAAHDTMRDDVRHLRRVRVVKYEDLVSQPDTVLKGVADFLGLDSPLDASAVDAAPSQRYAAVWRDEQASDNPRVRRRTARCIERFGRRTQEYGYDMVDLDVVEPLPFPVGESTGTSRRQEP